MPQIYDMGPTALLSLRRNACWGFFRPKNPTASAGFEPANLGTKGQHRSRFQRHVHILKGAGVILMLRVSQAFTYFDLQYAKTTKKQVVSELYNKAEQPEEQK